jgi:ABC-type uncharacterized transport system involved in gliding motility auxiliary subunit
MSMKWMKTRQTKYSAYATSYILVVLAVLVAANWLANRYNKSYDSTTNKRYTLSDQTLKVAGGLKQDVSIIYFDETPGFARGRDLLDRYKNLTNKIQVQYIDPVSKPLVAKQYGVNRMGSIVLVAGEKRQDANSLSEEEVTSALIRLFKTTEKTVCFTTGAGEHAAEETGGSGYSGIKDAIEKSNYKTQIVNLLEQPEIPATCSIVVVAGPRLDYPQPALDALKKRVEGGGATMFLLDPPINTGKQRIAENAGLMNALKDWGVTVQKDLVLDTSGVGGLYGMGPEVALATKYGEQPIVRDMKRVVTAFPMTRSLEVKPGAQTDAQSIVSTTKGSVAATDLNAAGGSIKMPKGEPQSYNVAAAGSYRTGQKRDNNDVQGRFVVVGSSDWVANYALGFGGNKDLMLNMVNWLSSDEDMISIRPKDPEDRRIQLTRAQLLSIRMVSQFLIPLCVIAFGLMVWWRRR